MSISQPSGSIIYDCSCACKFSNISTACVYLSSPSVTPPGACALGIPTPCLSCLMAFIFSRLFLMYHGLYNGLSKLIPSQLSPSLSVENTSSCSIGNIISLLSSSDCIAPINLRLDESHFHPVIDCGNRGSSLRGLIFSSLYSHTFSNILNPNGIFNNICLIVSSHVLVMLRKKSSSASSAIALSPALSDTGSM